MTPRVGAIVLAAGASRRLGQPKQLARAPVRGVPGGVPLVRIAADAACASSCARVAVVLGARAALVGAALDARRVALVETTEWREGIAASIRAGITWAAREGWSAALLLACDQPRVHAAHLDALIDAWRAGAPAAGSRYLGVLGVPAVFDRALFARLARLEGDRGARDVLRGEPNARAIDWPDGARDVDTPADLAGAQSA